MLWMIVANVRRRKARVLMTVVGIAIGVATLFALLAVSAGTESALRREIDGLGAHILLLPEGCPYALTLALMQGTDTLEYIPAEILPQVQALENVRLAVPVVVGKVRLGGELVSIYGASDELAHLKGWDLPGLRGAVVGSNVAAQLGLKKGQRLKLELYKETELEIAAVLRPTGGRDDTFIFVPLSVAQELLGLREMFSAILVKTEDIAKAAVTRSTLSRLGNVQAVPPTEVFDTLVALFGSVKSTLILITGIALVVGVLTTMNTMTTAVYERKKDIGILRAVGATRWDVFRLFMMESLAISLLAGAVGIVLGYAATFLLPKESGFGMSTAPVFSLGHVGLCLLVAAVVGSASGLYPAMQATRTQPVQALREI